MRFFKIPVPNVVGYHWHQVVYSDVSRFNLWDHDGRIRVRRYVGERCFLECVIQQHSGLTSGVMVWDAISYHGRSNLLRIIKGYLNSNSPTHATSFLASLFARYVAYGSLWDLIGRRLARDPHPAASKDEILLRI
ncbi:transposable element Tc1 transposase [Trichonephila clavipes]|nr:transposable element Tc1 transposase [Trichonephila clavipes]